MTDRTDTERARFEAAMRQRGRTEFERFADDESARNYKALAGEYIVWSTQDAWIGWLAAKADAFDQSVQRLADHIHPGLFSDDATVAHMAASPLKVEVARETALAKARDAITASMSSVGVEGEGK